MLYNRALYIKKLHQLDSYIWAFLLIFSSICESVSKLFCSELYVILLVILLLVKPPVASAVFSVAVFEIVSGVSVTDC